MKAHFHEMCTNLKGISLNQQMKLLKQSIFHSSTDQETRERVEKLGDLQIKINQC